MTTAIDVSWLSRLISQTQPELKSIGMPHGTVFEGQHWSYVCDGWHFVAVQAPSDFLAWESEPTTGFPSMFAKFLTNRPAGNPVNLAELKAWAGDPEWDNREALLPPKDCRDCDGTGELTGHCNDCHRSGDEECSHCKGTGSDCDRKKVDRPRAGNLGGLIVHRTQLARCIAEFTDSTVIVALVTDALSQFIIYGPGWVVVLNSGKNVYPETDLAELPAFSLAEVAS